jgi:hypothetical protein
MGFTIFWSVTSCSLVDSTRVSKKYFALIFRVEVKFEYEYVGSTLKLLYWILRQCNYFETLVSIKKKKNTRFHIILEDRNIKRILLDYITQIFLPPRKLLIGSWEIPTFTADISKIHFNIILPFTLCGVFRYFSIRILNVILFYIIRATSSIYFIFFDTHWQH